MHLDVVPVDALIELSARTVTGKYVPPEYSSAITLLFVAYRTWKSKRDKGIQESRNRDDEYRTARLERHLGIIPHAMFPLEKREIGGYRFKARTWYTKYHRGVDYRANQDILKAPCRSKVVQISRGIDAGNCMILKPLEAVYTTTGEQVDVHFRFLHLNRTIAQVNQEVQVGDTIAVTGNTGVLTTGAHLHLDCPRSISGNYTADIENFIDPESIDWDRIGKEPVVQNTEPHPVPFEEPPFQVVITGRLGANARNQPTTESEIFQLLRKGDVVNCKGMVNGQTVNGSNQWFWTKRSGKYIHSSVATRK